MPTPTKSAACSLLNVLLSRLESSDLAYEGVVDCFTFAFRHDAGADFDFVADVKSALRDGAAYDAAFKFVDGCSRLVDIETADYEHKRRQGGVTFRRWNQGLDGVQEGRRCLCLVWAEIGMMGAVSATVPLTNALISL